MREFRIGAIGILLSFGCIVHAQSAADLRGIFVSGTDFPVSKQVSTQLAAALPTPGVDGLLLGIAWDSLETGMGQYDWSTLDQWVGMAVSLGKKVKLSLPAHSAPAWLFQPAPGGGGATPLTFSYAPHDATKGCFSETIAAPWDPAFLAQWDSYVAAVAAHLKSTGTYNSVSIIQLTGINFDSGELHLASQTPQSSGLSCVTDAIATWQGAGYRPSRLLQGWDSLTSSLKKSFPDKFFSVAIIASTHPFPQIAEDGSIINFTDGKALSVTQNLPLLTLASQKFAGRMIIQNDTLYPGVAVPDQTVQSSQTLGTLVAFQTNLDFGPSGGASCGPSIQQTAVCTDATFLSELETGVYPLGRSNTLRAQYLEVFAANAVALPNTILQAHLELTCDYALNLSGQAFSSQGGSGTITITTGTGCPWTVGALPAGVTLTSAGSGTGNGIVTFQVLANGGGDHSSSFSVAEQTFTIEQSASSIAGLAAAGSLGQVASEGGWDFSLIGVNLGTSAATARFSFADDDGNPLMLPLTFPQLPPAAGPELAATLDRTLNPNAQVVMDSTGPDSVTPLAGSGQLLSTGSVSGFGIFSNPKVHWNAVVPLETRNASKYILAFDNTGALTTGLAIANLAAQAISVPVVIRDDTGKQIGNPQPISLGALGHVSFMLNDPQLGFPVTKGKRGTIEFDTPSGQLSVLGLRANGPALTTLPVLADVGTTGGAITHLAYNGGWTSVFYIVNTGSASAQFTLSFADENGIALAVPLLLPQSGTNPTTSALTRTLAPGEMLVVDTNQQDSPIAQSGSAQLTTTGNISGFEIFRWNTFGQEASVPLETRTPNSFVLVFDDTGGLTTGVALASNFGLQVNVSATFRDDTGAQIGVPQTITVPAHGHKSFLLPDLLQAAAGKRGMVEFATPQGQPFSVIGLRARSSDGTLTTIPVLTK